MDPIVRVSKLFNIVVVWRYPKIVITSGFVLAVFDIMAIPEQAAADLRKASSAGLRGIQRGSWKLENHRWKKQRREKASEAIEGHGKWESGVTVERSAGATE